MRIASEIMTLANANANARKSAPKDLGLDLLILKEKKRRPNPKGCFKIGICEMESKSKSEGDREKRIYTEHLPTGKRIVGKSAKGIMDTILRLDMVSLLKHASYLSMKLTKAELALRLNRSYEQDETVFSFLL